MGKKDKPTKEIGKPRYVLLFLFEASYRHVDQLMQQPSQRHGYGDGDKERGPIAKAIRLHIAEHEMDMYEVCLKAHRSHQLAEVVEPPWCASEHTVEHQDGGYGERYVEHALHEEGKLSVAHLFEIEACAEGHGEGEKQQTDRRAGQRGLLLDILSHVDADEEDGHATPEDLEMSHGMVYGQHPLHHDAPHNHEQRQPTIHGPSRDELHVSWCEGVKHHYGWHIPEGQLIMQPEVPVDEDVAKHVDYAVAVASVVEIVGHIIEACHQQPHGVDAQVTAFEEMCERRILRPRIPQSHSTKEQEHVHSHIAASSQPVEWVATTQAHMKEYDEEHCRSHQFAAVAADIC